METSVVVLLIVVVLVVLGVVGYLVYKHVIEPKYGHMLHHIHDAHHAVSHHMDHPSVMSMAGHLSHKMAKAKAHSSQAVKIIQHAKHHLNQAQMHAHA